MAVYLIAMQMDETFRPAGWPEQVARWLKYDTPYMKEFVLDHMPQPIPEAALKMLPDFLADEYVDLQIAACKTAGRHPRESFKAPLLRILQKASQGRFGVLLNEAAKAAPANGIPPDRVMEIWIERLDPTDLGRHAVVRLLLSILADNRANTPELNPENALDVKKRWLRFVDENRKRIRDGHQFKIGDPEITPDLFPPGFRFYHKDKAWPLEGTTADKPAEDTIHTKTD